MELMNVPVTLSSHLEESLQDLVDDNRVPENYGACVDTGVNIIEHKSYDGFMPFTNGGFDLTIPTNLMAMYSSGSGPTNKAISDSIEKTIEDSLEMALKEFCEKNATKLCEFFTDEEITESSYDVINYHGLYDIDQGDLAEQLSEIEHTYLTEGSTFFYQFRAMYYSADNARNESGEDEILFLAGVNLDYEYGRDSGLEVTYELNVPVKDLTIDMIDDIIFDMVDSI